MQDFSKFTEEDFDVKDWINNAFKAQKDGASDVSRFTALMILSQH